MKFTNEIFYKVIVPIGWMFIGGVIFLIYFYGFLALHAFTPILPSKFLNVGHELFECSELISDLSAACKLTNSILLALHELTHYLLVLSIFCILFYGTLRIGKINFSSDRLAYFSVGALLIWLFFFLAPLIFHLMENENEIPLGSLALNIGEMFLFLCAMFFLSRRGRSRRISKVSS